MIKRWLVGTLGAAGVWLLTAWQGQQPAPLAVGTMAPDFTLPSATRTGLGKPVKLSDFRGQVVVLAFFFRARTAG